MKRYVKPMRMQKTARGASIIEFAIIAPLLILFGLGVVQTGQVFHGKSALNFALQEAARMGAVSHGDITKVQQGFTRGLVPYMGGSTSRLDFERVWTTRVLPEFALGSTTGWIRMNQLSPSPESFADWAENAFDASGNPVRQIPNANLAILRCTRAPNGGVGGSKNSSACPGGERIGSASQQTLADANLLKLELTYGVRMSIPIINRVVGATLAAAAGCRAPENVQVGALNLGDTVLESAQPAKCAHYLARDARGNPAPRFPVNLAVTVRMQTPARNANSSGGWYTVAGRTQSANTSGPTLGNGTVWDASRFAPVPVATLNPRGLAIGSDEWSRRRGDGSTALGFNRTLTYEPPPFCESPVTTEPPPFTPVPRNPLPFTPAPTNASPSALVYDPATSGAI
jgi:hypothetical protein